MQERTRRLWEKQTQHGAIDERYRLTAVVASLSGHCSVNSRHLDTHLIPERDIAVTKEHLHASGRAVVCTKSPFAHLFERVT